jgi:hypothetical protein
MPPGDGIRPPRGWYLVRITPVTVSWSLPECDCPSCRPIG